MSVASLYNLSSGMNISVFISDDDDLWYWYPTGTQEEPVGPYPTERSAVLDAEQTEQLIDLTRPYSKTRAGRLTP